MWQTDEQLHDAVQRSLNEDATFDTQNIGLIATDGVVALTGFVGCESDRLAVEQAVKHVRGVRAVANDLQIKRPGERTDAEIAKEAVAALRTQTGLADRVTLTVRGGVVTLEGTVEWMHQKTTAESAVMYLNGVNDVLNRIHIGPVASARDVRHSIEDALLRGAVSDSKRILIDVDDAVITLRGNVHSWAERLEAEQAAWAAPGVARVENHIVVEP
jgi:osmotically-inducible protein OsmY